MERIMNRRDKILALALIVSAVLCMLVSSFVYSGGAADVIIVEADGAEAAKYNFKNMDGKEVKTFYTEYGWCTVEVDSSGAKITDSSCEDKYCIKHEKVCSPNSVCICLPARIAVYAEGGKAYENAVSY